MGQSLDYGIDLGTTNSCIAHFNRGSPTVLQNNDQMMVTPSAVRITRTGRVIVGRKAADALSADPENVAVEFKRLMGQQYSKTFPASGRSMTAEELSAEVLKALLENARRLTGKHVQHAVITVPAAFGVQQCEATARAARLAGMGRAPLLQEPIAAALAHGAQPSARDQHWMVFDLGGGTLDVAIVSTKHGRLTALEHRGNNHMGGKDIDRLIVERLFLPALAENYSLPDPDEDPQSFSALFRKLLQRAEQEKIVLSTSPETKAGLFDLGEDEDGRTIEMEMLISQAFIDSLMEPLLNQCMQLVDEALGGARLKHSGIDSVILVGGPTQMPAVRKALDCLFPDRVLYSLDPMTVVARGAAIYASSVDCDELNPVAVPTGPSTASLRLSYNSVSPTPKTQLQGQLEAGIQRVSHIRIDSHQNAWTTGWIPVSATGGFEIDLTLSDQPLTEFHISAKDDSGRLVETQPNLLTIRRGIIPDSPPLPRTISIEIVSSDGTTRLDGLIPRNTPLPCRRKCEYVARRTIRPGDPEDSLAIKVWEGENLTRPALNTWIGNIHIYSQWLSRPIPEGTPILISVDISDSRLISVEVSVPHIDATLSRKMYVPVETRPDRDLFETRVKALYEFLEELEEKAETDGEFDRLDELGRLRQELERADEESSCLNFQGDFDIDKAGQLMEDTRLLGERLQVLHKTLRRNDPAQEKAKAFALAEATGEAIQASSETDKRREWTKNLDTLRRTLDRAAEKGDLRGIRKASRDLDRLQWEVLHEDIGFLIAFFKYLTEHEGSFADVGAAQKWLKKGHESAEQNDKKGLREAIGHLHELLQPTEMEVAREKALPSDLRRR